MDYASSEEIHFDAVQWFPDILVKPLNERKARKIQNYTPFKCNNNKDQFEILRNSEVSIEFQTDGSVSLSKFTDKNFICSRLISSTALFRFPLLSVRIYKKPKLTFKTVRILLSLCF